MEPWTNLDIVPVSFTSDSKVLAGNTSIPVATVAGGEIGRGCSIGVHGFSSNLANNPTGSTNFTMSVDCRLPDGSLFSGTITLGDPRSWSAGPLTGNASCGVSDLPASAPRTMCLALTSPTISATVSDASGGAEPGPTWASPDFHRTVHVQFHLFAQGKDYSAGTCTALVHLVGTADVELGPGSFRAQTSEVASD